MRKQETPVKNRECLFEKPKYFKVIIHNDNFTAMDFVVEILMTFFYKSNIEAKNLTMQINDTQYVVAGIYSYDIAKSRIQKAAIMARNENCHLRLTISPDN